MTKVKRGFDLLTDEKRRSVVSAIMDYYATERDETIGVIAANEILDLMLETIAPVFYNKGVEDALKFVKERYEVMELDANALLKK